MDTFYIVISCIFIFLLVAAIVLWVIESRMEYKRKKLVTQKIDSGRGLRLEDDDLYLKVKNGVVEICEEPNLTAAEERGTAQAEYVPPVVPINDETAAAYVSNVEDFVNRYGEITEKSVVFESDKNENKTFVERYAALSMESRARYDDIVAYILKNSDCKKIEASGAVTFKCNTDKIMRAVIKRDTVVLNFMLFNNDLNRFVKEEGIKKIKFSPVTIKLAGDSDLLLAKQTADITLENIREEQQYRKDRKREMRRIHSKKKEQTDNV